MSALPVYEVEFIPLERRLGDRRVAPRGAALPPEIKADRREWKDATVAEKAALPPEIKADRRKVSSRRTEDRKSAALKVV